jgi:CDP-diacylglycerol--serine O-phosphatidyltransferase
MKIKPHIPNFLTCVSLAFGFYAAVLGLTGNYPAAMIAIFIAAVFDFSDGLAARLLKAYSPLGKELDSLADLVSFGVAPGMMLFHFTDALLHTLSWNEGLQKLLLLSTFALPVFSALRLAKFNIDTRQSTSFLGLPVPAHAIFWSSLIVTLAAGLPEGVVTTPAATWHNTCFHGLIPPPCIETHALGTLLIALSIFAILTSLLLVSEIPLFSLKASSRAWRANKPQYIFLIAALFLLLLFGSLGISATIPLYILLSFLFRPSLRK